MQIKSSFKSRCGNVIVSPDLILSRNSDLVDLHIKMFSSESSSLCSNTNAPATPNTFFSLFNFFVVFSLVALNANKYFNV